MTDTAIAAPSLLKAEGLDAWYGEIQVLHGVDFEVAAGEVIVILGANGAGKTTTLRSVCGVVRTGGSLMLDGESISGKQTSDIIRMGIGVVPQGRGTLVDLTVDDNLRAGAFVRKDRREINEDIDYWYEIFPRLAERRDQLGGSLSGGEQQMLAVARAMMSRPRLLLLDEPSLGLAPVIVQQVFDVLRGVNEERGIAMVIVEQNVALALELASRAYVLEAGHIAVTGSAAELREDDAVRRAYLGY